VSPNDGIEPQESAEKSLGAIVAEVSEKASLLVREEIELAKAEVRDKISKLTKGVVVGIVAGFFVMLALLYFLTALSWFFSDLYGDVGTEIWQGFLTTFGILVLLGVITALLAVRWLKRGSPPTPDLAIEEAKRTREELERQSIERDQLGRTLEKGEEVSV
jgi:uncharacterized membrane protein YqjE